MKIFRLVFEHNKVYIEEKRWFWGVIPYWYGCMGGHPDFQTAKIICREMSPNGYRIV